MIKQENEMEKGIAELRKQIEDQIETNKLDKSKEQNRHC